MADTTVTSALAIHPLTPERWGDLETLFGRAGASGGCWCMWWRVPNKEYDRGAGNKQAFHTITEEKCERGSTPGLLAYADGAPVGWVSLGPRADYRRFPSMRSDVFRPVDETPVWSIVCFFVRRKQRRQGITAALLEAAIAYARAHGAQVLEAYPNDLEAIAAAGGKVSAVSIYMGTRATFAAAGFEEVARRHPTRPIMRLTL